MDGWMEVFYEVLVYVNGPAYPGTEMETLNNDIVHIAEEAWPGCLLILPDEQWYMPYLPIRALGCDDFYIVYGPVSVFPPVVTDPIWTEIDYEYLAHVWIVDRANLRFAITYLTNGLRHVELRRSFDRRCAILKVTDHR